MKNENWSLNTVPDLSGKVIMVTGGNSGLGYESVKAFIQKGATVILASRSLERGENAKTEILKILPDGIIEVVGLDLMDLTSIQKCAHYLSKNYKRLDILLNNAGIMTPPYEVTKDGFESQMGTNHLGHFALTGQLLPLLKNASNSRIVNVSSIAHKQGKMDFENFLFEDGKGYTRMGAYGRSKLANLLFTLELNILFKERDISTIAVSAHPGVSETNLIRFIEKKPIFRILKPIIGAFTQSASRGALPQIRAAVDNTTKRDDYYGPDGFNEMKGNPVLVQSVPAAHNRDDSKSLWTISEKVTGVKYFD